MNTQADRLYAYVKDNSAKVFAGSHNIHTPQALVEEILNKIALTGEIAVLFNVEFVISLVYTYKVDPSMISFYSDHANKVALVKKMGVNKIIDSLDKDNMKFDVVIGNPPYQEGDTGTNKTVFDKFYARAMNISNGLVVFVAPTMWLTSTKKRLVDLRSLLQSNGLYHVDLIDAQRVFGVNVDSLGITYNDVRNSYSSFTITLLDGTSVYQSSNGSPAVLTSNTAAASILTKVDQIPYKLNAHNSNLRSVGNDGTCSNGEASLIQTTDHPYKMINKVSSGSVEYAYTRSPKNTHAGMYRVAFSQLSSRTSLGTITILDDLTSTTSRAVVYVPVASMTEATVAKAFLESKVFRFVLSIRRTNTLNAVGLLCSLPAVDFTRSWTDDELYAHFNLTQEEIDLIEATVK